MQHAALSQVPMEDLEQWMVYTSCVTSSGNCLESLLFPPYILKGISQEPQCATHNCCECHVRFLLYLYVYTCFTHKYFIEVWDNLCVYSIHANLSFAGRENRINKTYQGRAAFQAWILKCQSPYKRDLSWSVSNGSALLYGDTSQRLNIWTLYLTDPVCRTLGSKLNKYVWTQYYRLLWFACCYFCSASPQLLFLVF